MFTFSIKSRVRRFYIVVVQSRCKRNVLTYDARAEQPRSQGSLSLFPRESTLVAAGHVKMCVNEFRRGGRPSTKFFRLDDDSEILYGVGRKFLLQNIA